MASFQTIACKSGCYTAYISGSLVILDFATSASVADMHEMTAMLKKMGAKTGKISMISIAPEKASKLDDDVRAAIKEQGEQTGAMMMASAVVIRGTSLSSLLVRTIISGINALSKHSSPTKTFATPTEALQWLKTVPGQFADVKALSTSDLPAERLAKAA